MRDSTKTENLALRQLKGDGIFRQMSECPPKSSGDTYGVIGNACEKTEHAERGCKLKYNTEIAGHK